MDHPVENILRRLHHLLRRIHRRQSRSHYLRPRRVRPQIHHPHPAHHNLCRDSARRLPINLSRVPQTTPLTLRMPLHHLLHRHSLVQPS